MVLNGPGLLNPGAKELNPPPFLSAALVVDPFRLHHLVLIEFEADLTLVAPSKQAL